LTLSTSGNAATDSSQSLYFAGSIAAAGGAPQAAGGTLNITSATNGGTLISQSGNVAAALGNTPPTTRSQLRGLLPAANGTYLITADTINSANSGLDTVSFNGAFSSAAMSIRT
jgi:hypothetical protein